MSYLYGDSSTFPHDVDYIELSLHAVDCAVQLLSAQHAIGSALARAEEQNQLLHQERVRLHAIADALGTALAPFLDHDSEPTLRAAARALECAKASLQEALADSECRAVEADSHARHVAQRAGESAYRALEAFMVRHDVPETELGLYLACSGELSYAGEVSILTPFGVRASFVLCIREQHTWARPRRVSDLLPGVEVHVPQPKGWLSRRVEMAPIKLDRLFLSSVQMAGNEVELCLRKAPSSGSGYRFSIDLRGQRGVTLTPLDDAEAEDAEPPLVLDGDGAPVRDLAQRVRESIVELTALRGSMCSVTLDGQPLDEPGWPEAVAHRLLGQLAPTVLEIARRSGAPGEWVLRRDVGDRRREESYATKAQLWERLLVLPPERRAAFAALGLTQPVLPPPVEVAPLAIPLEVQPLLVFDVATPAALVTAGPAA